MNLKKLFKRKTKEELHFEKGCDYMDKRDYDNAIIEFNKAIDLKHDGAAIENRAIAYLRKGNYKSAKLDLLHSIFLSQQELEKSEANQKLIKRDLSASYYHLAVCDAHLGDKELALINLDECLYYFPHDDPKIMICTMGDIKNFIAEVKQMKDNIYE